MMTFPEERRPASRLFEPQQVRQSVKTGRQRWVLALSLLLGVLVLGGTFAWYASGAHDRPSLEHATASRF